MPPSFPPASSPLLASFPGPPSDIGPVPLSVVLDPPIPAPERILLGPHPFLWKKTGIGIGGCGAAGGAGVLPMAYATAFASAARYASHVEPQRRTSDLVPFFWTPQPSTFAVLLLHAALNDAAFVALAGTSKGSLKLST